MKTNESTQPSGQEKWRVENGETVVYLNIGKVRYAFPERVKQFLVEIAGAHNASLSQPSEDTDPNNKIFDHKWLDSECIASGCQSLFVKELRDLIGQPPEGSHPDEWKPRAETWHQERLNWQAEVERLRSQPSGQEKWRVAAYSKKGRTLFRLLVGEKLIVTSKSEGFLQEIVAAHNASLSQPAKTGGEWTREPLPSIRQGKGDEDSRGEG